MERRYRCALDYARRTTDLHLHGNGDPLARLPRTPDRDGSRIPGWSRDPGRYVFPHGTGPGGTLQGNGPGRREPYVDDRSNRREKPGLAGCRDRGGCVRGDGAGNAPPGYGPGHRLWPELDTGQSGQGVQRRGHCGNLYGGRASYVYFHRDGGQVDRLQRSSDRDRRRNAGWSLRQRGRYVRPYGRTPAYRLYSNGSGSRNPYVDDHGEGPEEPGIELVLGP